MWILTVEFRKPMQRSPTKSYGDKLIVYNDVIKQPAVPTDYLSANCFRTFYICACKVNIATKEGNKIKY
jgi:hypothetical protein